MNKTTEFLEEWNRTHSSQPSWEDAIEWAEKRTKEAILGQLTDVVDSLSTIRQELREMEGLLDVTDRGPEQEV